MPFNEDDLALFIRTTISDWHQPTDRRPTNLLVGLALQVVEEDDLPRFAQLIARAPNTVGIPLVEDFAIKEGRLEHLKLLAGLNHDFNAWGWLRKAIQARQPAVFAWIVTTYPDAGTNWAQMVVELERVPCEAIGELIAERYPAYIEPYRLCRLAAQHGWLATAKLMLDHPQRLTPSELDTVLGAATRGRHDDVLEAVKGKMLCLQYA